MSRCGRARNGLQIALDTGKLGSWQLDFATLHMDCTAWLVADDEHHTGFRFFAEIHQSSENSSRNTGKREIANNALRRALETIFRLFDDIKGVKSLCIFQLDSVFHMGQD
jgi:hypothetical protein